MATRTFPLASTPGVKRDGTDFDGNYFTDAQHCRFMRGRPRKMGGYRKISNGFSGPISATFVSAVNGQNTIHTGHPAGIEMIVVDDIGSGGAITDRTPVGFTSSTGNIWQFDSMWDAAGSKSLLLAHAAPNDPNIDSDVDRPVYAGDINGTGVLTPVGKSVSGGVCVLPPFCFLYGSNGQIIWSDENLPYTYTGGASGSARITASKIVKGMAYRGGPTNSPSGLFWSLDSLLRASYVGGTAIFRFDTLSDQTSILSSSSVIEYDGMFFWPGVDRFWGFSGVVKELPNQMSCNYFFEGINMAARQKVWGMKVPRFGELWWFYPRGTATECTHAVIYNIRENTWYDTELSRSAGHFPQVFPFPIMADPTVLAGGKYGVWVHETGYDEVDGSQVRAIPSWFESANICMAAQNPTGQGWAGNDQWLQIMRIEPDFVSRGEMECYIRGRNYAQSTDVSETQFLFNQSTEKIDMKEQRRIMTVKFANGSVGGFYEMGQLLLHFEGGDRRQ